MDHGETRTCGDTTGDAEGMHLAQSGLLSWCTGTPSHKLGGSRTSTTYPFTSIEKFQSQTGSSSCGLGWREVNHIIVHNGQLHQVLGQNVLFQVHLQ